MTAADALRDRLRSQVKLYLADCAGYGLTPSAGKRLKVVYTANGEQQGIVRDVYAELTGTRQPDDHYGQRRR